MSFEVEGKLHKVFDAEQKTESFRTREFVIETQQGQYAQFIKFQLTQDRCDSIDPFREGQQIKVYFDLRDEEFSSSPVDNSEGGANDFDDLPF